MNPRLKPLAPTPLFDFAERKAASERRRERGMAEASIGAENRSPGWHADAIEAIRRYALEHETFLAEDVRPTLNSGSVDGRAWGPVFKLAERMKLIRQEGYGLANCSNRSPRVKWRSLLFAPR